MSVALCDETVLTDVLTTIYMSTDQQGELSPLVVVGIIDEICGIVDLTVDKLPQDLRDLRSDALSRNVDSDAGYAEEYVGDIIVMCSLWAA